MTSGVENPPSRRRGTETRERLTQAAVAVFARSGYDRATVDEIVREAGFSKGAFYVHFESKEDLFWSMLTERIGRHQDAFRDSIDHQGGVADNVRTILTAVFDLAEADPLWSSLFMEFSAHAGRNEKARQLLADMYGRWRESIVLILEAGRAAGRIREDIDAKFIATIIVAAVEGSIMQARLAPEAVRLRKLIDPLARTLSEWLKPVAGPAKRAAPAPAPAGRPASPTARPRGRPAAS
jgi:AcrR family transcriptional regulator